MNHRDIDLSACKLGIIKTKMKTKSTIYVRILNEPFYLSVLDPSHKDIKFH